MGGAYRVPGNTAPTTEWNIHCDPEAAKIAFARGPAAGATASAPARPRPRRHREGEDPARARRRARPAGRQHAGRLDRAGARRGPDARDRCRWPSNPVVRYVADALRFYMEFHARYDGFYGAFIHDPLAVAAALDPSLVTTRGAHRRRRARRDAHGRRDRDRLARRLGPAAERRRRGRGRRRRVPAPVRRARRRAGSASRDSGTLDQGGQERPGRRGSEPGGRRIEGMSSELGRGRSSGSSRSSSRSSVGLIIAGPLDLDAGPEHRRRRSASTRSSLVIASRCSSASSPTPRPSTRRRAARVDHQPVRHPRRSCSSRSRSRSTSSSARPSPPP